jgi:2-polyprenyl-3-methyl-5-hydroxy-6-metoxy-1,4-benzoquinol methylase
MISPCPICKSTAQKLLHKLDEGQLIRCKSCNAVFFTPFPTAEELRAYYDSIAYREGYQACEMTDQGFSENRYYQLSQILSRYDAGQKMLAGLKSGKSLLDAGCGVGDFLAVAQHHGWQVEGVEISARAAQAANHRVGERVKVGEVVHLEFPHTYDLITSYHVIEHLLDPVLTLSRFHDLLKPGGVLFLETPNIDSLGARIRGKNWSHIIPPEHIVYFGLNSLAYSLRQAGFEEVYVFSSVPYTIKSLSKIPFPLKGVASWLYHLAPALGMGAALQAVAVKH